MKQVLKNDTLKEWQVSEVYKIAFDIEVTEAKATCEIHFTNAEQKKAIAPFDEAGKIVVARNEN